MEDRRTNYPRTSIGKKQLKCHETLKACIWPFAEFKLQCNCNLGTLLVYYHWVKATVWWTVSQQSPSVFSTPVSKYFGTKNRYYFENWQYLKFSKFIKLRSISLVQSSVLSWFWHYCLGPSGSVFTLNFLPYKPTRLPPYFEDCRLFVLNQTLLFRFLIFQIFWLYLHWWDINCWKKKNCWNDHLQNLN